MGDRHPGDLHGLPVVPGASAEPARRNLRYDLHSHLLVQGASRRGGGRGALDAVLVPQGEKQFHAHEHVPRLLRGQPCWQSAEQVEEAGAGAEEEHLRYPLYAQLKGIPIVITKLVFFLGHSPWDCFAVMLAYFSLSSSYSSSRARTLLLVLLLPKFV